MCLFTCWRTSQLLLIFSNYEWALLTSVPQISPKMDMNVPYFPLSPKLARMDHRFNCQMQHRKSTNNLWCSTRFLGRRPSTYRLVYKHESFSPVGRWPGLELLHWMIGICLPNGYAILHSCQECMRIPEAPKVTKIWQWQSSCTVASHWCLSLYFPDYGMLSILSHVCLSVTYSLVKCLLRSLAHVLIGYLFSFFLERNIYLPILLCVWVFCLHVYHKLGLACVLSG